MISIIVHGGAWAIPDDEVDAHRYGCLTALSIGWDILRGGGTAIDAIEHAIRSMEDDETYDAGRGSHLNVQGMVQLDASIMDGNTLRCGAVAGVQRIEHPISLVRKIMESSEHILLIGNGAEQFASEHGVQLCNPEDLVIPRERARWEAIQKSAGFFTKDSFKRTMPSSDTVGAIALDSAGNICVGTSTGGTLNKYPGRVGDSPLIGCGTYADNEIGGVSSTGWGEAIIKVVLAKTVIDSMEGNGGNAQGAAVKGISLLQQKADGYGGVIVMNSKGAIGVAYNTPRMARAYMNSEMTVPFVGI
jgi:L-asparaginase / beta-aspartyl-peptidase